MVWEFNLATLGVIVVQSVALVVWLVRIYDTASAAAKQVGSAELQLDIHTAQIALIREQFVRKEDLQHLEASIGKRFDSLQARLDTYFTQRP